MKIKSGCFCNKQLKCDQHKSLGSVLQEDNLNSGNEFARILEAGRRKPGRDFFSNYCSRRMIELLEQRTIRSGLAGIPWLPCQLNLTLSVQCKYLLSFC